MTKVDYDEIAKVPLDLYMCACVPVIELKVALRSDFVIRINVHEDRSSNMVVYGQQSKVLYT